MHLQVPHNIRIDLEDSDKILISEVKTDVKPLMTVSRPCVYV